jgi:glyoxylase-like metal-dependent hydrolase (beta-lactamase superfamily II)
MDIHSFKLHYTNCFLIPYDRGWLLIDTGYDWEWEEFLKGLSGYGLAPRDISHLLLTHAHDDHAGLLNRMAQSNPDLSLIVSDRAVGILRSGAHLHSDSGGYVTRRMHFLAGLKARFDKSWTHTFPPYIARPFDRTVNENTRLSSLGLNLEGTIIPTPGHTDDSISLVMDDGTCYCGDAAANFFGFAGTHKCVVYVRNIEEYYRSWDLILDAGAAIIHPSHGKAFPAEDLRKEHGHHKRVYP